MRRRDFVMTGLTATGFVASRTVLYGGTESHHKMRDVIVLLPGIRGSVLQKDGRDLCVLSGGTIARSLRTRGASLATSLRLAGDAPDASNLDDGIIATRVLDTHFLPHLWRIDGYSQIRTRILKTFTATPNQNYFEF